MSGPDGGVIGKKARRADCEPFFSNQNIFGKITGRVSSIEPTATKGPSRWRRGFQRAGLRLGTGTRAITAEARPGAAFLNRTHPRGRAGREGRADRLACRAAPLSRRAALILPVRRAGAGAQGWYHGFILIPSLLGAGFVFFGAYPRAFQS